MKAIDLALYARSKEFIQKWHLEHGVDPCDTVNRFAAATHIPCIVIAYWMGEIAGWTPKLLKTIESLKKFYGYTEILNKPDGSP